MNSVQFLEVQDQFVPVPAQNNIPSSKGQAADHHPNNTLNWRAPGEVVYLLDSQVDTPAVRHANMAVVRY